MPPNRAQGDRAGTKESATKWLAQALLVGVVGSTAVSAEASKPQPRQPWDTVVDSVEAHASLHGPVPSDDARVTESRGAARTVFDLPRNTSLLGRVLRGAVAVALISLGSYGLATGELDTPTGAVQLSASLLPAAVGATGYCPLTDALGISEGF